MDCVEGTFQMGDKELIFLGYNEDLPNVYFLGLNLLYYAQETNDKTVISLLNDVLQVSDRQLPDREYVPIQIKIEHNTITIDSPKDNVNTTIAYQDIFESQQEIEDVNNLLTVNKGKTVITLNYPMKKAGIMISLFGVMLFGIGMMKLLRNDFL